VLVGNKLEVDEVDKRPHLPRSLTSRKEVSLDLGADSSERVTADKSEVCEEDRHKNWAPGGLVNDNLFRYRNSILSRDLVVKPVVEIMARRSVVEKTKCRKGDESLHVERTPRNEKLCQQIT